MWVPVKGEIMQAEIEPINMQSQLLEEGLL